MTETTAVLLVIAAFLIVMPAMWIAIIYTTARLSGWQELAKLYPGPRRISGEICRFASARFRLFIGYNRNLTITLSPQGLHIRPMPLFRLRHPPLLVPGAAILATERKGLSLFPTLDMMVRSGDPARPFKITFFGRRLVEAIERHAQSGGWCN